MGDSWNVYVATFYALLYAFDELKNPSEGLREFLSEANPFVWKRKSSAAREVWIDFERDFLEHFPTDLATDEESLEFVRAYLARQSPHYISAFPGGDETPFLELFDSRIDLDEWTRMLDEHIQLPEDRMLTTAELNSLLFAEFPALKEFLIETLRGPWGMDTSCFLIYEASLLDIMEQAFEECDDDFLEQACDFIERLMTSGDAHAINVATVGILEGLKAHVDNELVRSYLGPFSARAFDEIAPWPDAQAPEA